MPIISINPLDKAELYAEAKAANTLHLMTILKRGLDDTLVLDTDIEANHVVDLLIYIKNRVFLQNPYWDDTKSPYDETHEDNVHEFQMGIWIKVLSELKSEMNIPFPGERTLTE